MPEEPFDLSRLNLGNIMGMARQLQEKMEKLQQELAQKTVEATAGGGMVTAMANGKQEILEIKISDELINMQDRQMLQDLTTAAVNEALARSKNLMQEEMQKLTGGIPLPGLVP